MPRSYLWLYGLREIMKSGRYSDLTLVCGDIIIPVQRAIVCAQSPVLAAACDSHFQEASTNVIAVNGFDLRTVKYMIDFMYKGSYDTTDHRTDSTLPASDGSDSGEPEIMFTVLYRSIKMNSIADYYDIKELREFSNIELKWTLEHAWMDAGDGFLRAVEYALRSTSDTALHSILATAMVRHYRDLRLWDEIFKFEMTSSFLIDVIQKMAAAFQLTGDNLQLTENRLEDEVSSREKEVSNLKVYLERRYKRRRRCF